MSIAGVSGIKWYRPTDLPIDPSTVADIGFSRMRVTSTYGERSDPLRPAAPTVFHDGLDIGNARAGDRLVAPAAARVIAAGDLAWPWAQPKPTDAAWLGWGGDPARIPSRWTGRSYGGLMVVAEAAPTVLWIMAHMETVDVEVGDQLQLGTPVGTVGDSGAAYGRDHVHFGIVIVSAATIQAHGSVDGRRWTVDPWPLISPQSSPGYTLPSGGRDMDWVNRMRHQKPKLMGVAAGVETFREPGGTPYKLATVRTLELVGQLDDAPGYWAFLGSTAGLGLVRRSDVLPEHISEPLVLPSTPEPTPPPDDRYDDGYRQAISDATEAVQALTPAEPG